jgi:hypothetical protein
MIPSFVVSVALAGCGPELSPEFEVRTRRFELPVEYNPRRADRIRSLELWVSQDRGRSWSRTTAIGPKDQKFVTGVVQDGEYWYGMHIEMVDGTFEPPYKQRPGSIQRVRVRTTVAAAFVVRIEIWPFGPRDFVVGELSLPLNPSLPLGWGGVNRHDERGR